MKKGLKIFAFVAVIGFTITACDTGTGPGTEPPYVAVTGVTLNYSTVTLAAGGSITLVATVSPGNATDKSVNRVSSDTDTVTVDRSGNIKAVAKGTATITVTTADGGFMKECIVTVTSVPDSITVTRQPDKTKYIRGEALDITGLMVTASYSDDPSGPVTVTAANVSGYNPSAFGEQTLTVTYAGKTTTFKVTVLDATSIAITRQPYKRRYVPGEALDITGLVVTVTYSEGSTGTATVTAANITGFDSSTLGVKTLTVTYGGKTATFTVMVLELVRIEITYQPDKTRYFPGEPLDLTGLAVAATYSDGGTEWINANVTGYDSSKLGEQTLTVTYGGKTATFTVTVSEITEINVTQQPDKTIYFIDEPLNLTGLVVTAVYNDGGTERINANVTGYNPSMLGEQTLTVTYNGKITTIKVTVVDKLFVEGNTLAQKLAWVNTYAVSNGIYILEVTEDESLHPQTLLYSGRNNVTVILKGTGGERKVSLNSDYGTLFTVSVGATLILDENITLQGSGYNNNSLVRVGNGGELVMETGSKISNNASSRNGGGVYVSVDGTFTMNGGEISANTVSSSGFTDSGYGGGVYVDGTFTMNDGKISGNTASVSSYRSGSGGGVYVSAGGTFTMNSGEISGNTASGSSFTDSSFGGGVFVYYGTFTMHGGEISSNTASVSVMAYAGSGNGGGVCVDSGTFEMTGGEISGNTAFAEYNDPTSYGGGVYVAANGTFRMVTGTVYGSNEADERLRNTAVTGAALYKDTNGTAQYGTFNGTTWNSLGTLTTDDNTIKVADGVIVP